MPGDGDGETMVTVDDEVISSSHFSCGSERRAMSARTLNVTG